METEPPEFILDCRRDEATLIEKEISDLISKLHYASMALGKLKDEISWLEGLIEERNENLF
jgi:hypothetical protein